MITRGPITAQGTPLLHNGVLIGSFIATTNDFRPSEVGTALGFEPDNHKDILACAEALAMRLNTTAYIYRPKITPTGASHDIHIKDTTLYAEYADILAEGQKNWIVRNENTKLACNSIKIPKSVPLFMAITLDAKKGAPNRYTAFISLFGRRVSVRTSETLNGLQEGIVWDMSYSMYAASTAYRAFRTLYGFEYNSIAYQNLSERMESASRSMKAIAAMAGATPAQIAKL